MRRFNALLLAAGLAAAPAGAVASPTNSSQPDPNAQTFEWSSDQPRLGLMIVELTPELRTHFGAPDHSGVLVGQVVPGTPAAKAGVAVGDVLVDVRGHSIDDVSDVRAALARVSKGQTAELKLVRDRKPMTVRATITSEVSRVGSGPNGPNGLDGPSWWTGRWFQRLFPDSEPGPRKTTRT